MDRNFGAWQDAYVDPADIGDMKKAIHDLRHPHADAVHVCGDHNGRPRGFACASLQAVQGTDAVEADLIHKRTPLLCNQAGDGAFIA